MSAVQLPHPAVSDFNLTIARGGAVANDEMVGKTVWHPAHMTMVIVEDASVALAGTAVMHDDVFPSVTRDPRVVDRFADCRSEVLPEDASAARSWDKVLLCFRSGFLNNDRFVVVILLAKEEPVSLLFRSRRGGLFFESEELMEFDFSPDSACGEGVGLGFFFGCVGREMLQLGWAESICEPLLPASGEIWLFERGRGRARRWFRRGSRACDDLHLLAAFQKEFAQTFFFVRLLADAMN